MKPKSSEGKGIKDFSGHNYYENDYDKKKELSDCCNAGVTINSGGEGTRYYVCDECHEPCDLKSWKSLDKKKTTNEQKWKVVKETISNQDGIIKSISFTKIPEKKTKELEWEKEFDNLNWNTDKGIMTKARVIKQSTGETVGQITIPVTKEMVKTFIKDLLTQQRTELLEEIKDIEIGEADGWELARKFNCCPGDDMADAYNQALKDVIKLLKKL